MPARIIEILYSYKKPINSFLYALIITWVLGYSISILGNIQYGSNDGSLVTNTAWPLHLGQTAYIDVVTGMPPLLLLSAKWSFDIFGITWSSIVTMTALMAMIFFVLQTYLFVKNEIHSALSILFSLYIQIVCWMPTSFLWHNGMTSASVALLISSVWLIYKHPSKQINYYLYVFSLFITLQTKPNLAATSIVLTYFYLILFTKSQKVKITLCVIFSIFLTYIFLAVFNGIHPISILNTYKLFSNRVLVLKNFVDILFRHFIWEKVLSLLLLILSMRAFSLFLKYEEKQKYEYLSFFLASLIISFIGATTNNDFKIQEITPVTTSIFLITTTSRGSYLLINNKPELLLNISILLSIIFGLVLSVTRIRIYEEGPDVFFQEPPLIQLHSPHFFQGVKTGQRMINVLAELQQFTENHGYLNNLSASVFFGPRLDFAYATYNIEPRPGIPLWWEAFKDDNIQTGIMVNRFAEQHYEHIVLLHCDVKKYICEGHYDEHGSDMTFFPEVLRQFIYSTYFPEYLDELTIYHIRK